ncbi:phosphatase PAP2 family protein [Aquihabitans sp. G128]|uniref:phosphatase PAP2 family protein n=1 Tax=Aquihabitans sp. G128 TaxID=2849779 RepID=UPI001C23A510|nr:phosphatase PAP2 family protein [Aquihabitans sp. G128]QXC63276.1 phosphatase PAP2 family protein [Aquihabitans sp. G128]
MTDTTTEAGTGATAVPARAPRLQWWREVAIAIGFYLVYSYVRNRFGAGPESKDIAFRHARGVIRVEKALGLWFEPRLQRWYLGLPGHGWVRAWNVFYGTAHFFVTIGLLALAFWKVPERYRFLRTMLAGTTALALFGFASYTLMPPRLLDASSEFGACRGQAEGCHRYGIIDTIDHYGGIWKFSQGEVAQLSNQYAAMPSLHFGWSTWCAITLVVIIGKGRLRWLAFLYPAATLFCILVTGNHFWLDAFFGGVALTGGYGVARVSQRLHEHWAERGADRATAPAAT